MADKPAELLQGTLELLVLKTLHVQAMHGWGISQRIHEMSRDAFQVSQGSLYPALQRMKRKGWIRSEWRLTLNNRRARYYLLTARGEQELQKRSTEWARTSSAVNYVLEWNGGTA